MKTWYPKVPCFKASCSQRKIATTWDSLKPHPGIEAQKQAHGLGHGYNAPEDMAETLRKLQIDEQNMGDLRDTQWIAHSKNLTGEDESFKLLDWRVCTVFIWTNQHDHFNYMITQKELDSVLDGPPHL